VTRGVELAVHDAMAPCLRDAEDIHGSGGTPVLVSKAVTSMFMRRSDDDVALPGL
jgi:hypothetical protein